MMIRNINIIDRKLSWHCILLLMLVFLLVACDAGIEVVPEPESVTFSVNAGDDQQIRMSDVTVAVTLFGSSSSSGELIYQWQQILGPDVSIADASQANTTFFLPEVTTDTELRFIFTVTDGAGHAFSDEVSIFIEAPVDEPVAVVEPVLAPGGFEVTAPNGNTVARDSVAWFGVRLTVQPIADVSIAVQSSDPNQGQVEVDTLTFTPTNWDFYQQVQVRGVNPSADGSRNYHIRLGTATSTDSNYAGVDPVDVHMQGIVLEVAEPQLQSALLARQELDLPLSFRYTGTDKLTFTLLQAPEGATLDFFSGRLRWTPKQEERGSEVGFSIRVTDGSRFARTRFQLSVLGSRSLNTEFNATGTKLLVVDEQSNLNGMSVGMQAGTVIADSAQVEIEVVSGSHLAGLPRIPASMIRVSDVFIAREQIQGSLQLEVPLSATLAEAQQQRLVLYSYEYNIHSNTKYWSELSLPRYIVGREEAPENKLLRLKLGGLDGLFFVGYKDSDIAPDSSASKPTRALYKARSELRSVAATAPLFANLESISDSSLVSCSNAGGVAQDATETDRQRTFATDCNSRDAGRPRLICKSSADPELRVCINSDGTTQGVIANAGSSVWSGTYRSEPYNITLRTIIGYLVDARVKAGELGMSYDETITVRFETITIGADIIILGLVRFGSENAEILHLLSSIASLSGGPAEVMKGVTVHEFFHHAQLRTRQKQEAESGVMSTVGGPGGWTIEGTANWFEGNLYTDVQSQLRTRTRLSRFMEVGLNTDSSVEPNGSTAVTNRYDPYDRGFFYTLVSSYCSGYSSGLFTDFITYFGYRNYGILPLNNALNNPEYGCDFGSHLGLNQRSSLASAISLYQYATLYKKDLRILSENFLSPRDTYELKMEREPTDAELATYSFTVPLTDPPVLANYSPAFPSFAEDFPSTAPTFSVSLPANSGYSFVVPGWRDLSDNQFAEFEVAVLDGDSQAIVSITSNDADFVGQNQNQIGPTNSALGSPDPHLSFIVPERGKNNLLYNFGGKTPELFVTIVNTSLTESIDVSAKLEVGAITDVDVIINAPLDGEVFNTRVISLEGEVPELLRPDTALIKVENRGMEWQIIPDADGFFTTNLVVLRGSNNISVTAVDTNGVAVGGSASIGVTGNRSATSTQNILEQSGVAFILRWQATAEGGTVPDLDLYATRGAVSIWVENRQDGDGLLVHSADGYGPEMITFASSSLENTNIDVDVHYFEGDNPVDFTLAVILNEDTNEEIIRRYSSQQALRDASAESGSGVGAASSTNTGARVNNILRVSCDSAGVCAIGSIDGDILMMQ